MTAVQPAPDLSNVTALVRGMAATFIPIGEAIRELEAALRAYALACPRETYTHDPDLED